MDTRGAQGPGRWSRPPPSDPSCLAQHLLFQDRKKGGLRRDLEVLPLTWEVATGSPCLSFPNAVNRTQILTSPPLPFPRDVVGFKGSEQPH